MEKDIRTLLVLKLGRGAFRAKDLANGTIVSVKSPESYKIAECDTVTFEVTKQWQFKKTTYLSGSLIDHHFDLEALDIPGHEFREVELVSALQWYEPYELKGFIGECLRGGKRMSYAFEDYTGYGFYQADCDPVTEANESDSIDQKYDKLAKLWEDYPQCIDALVHRISEFQLFKVPEKCGELPPSGNPYCREACSTRSGWHLSLVRTEQPSLLEGASRPVSGSVEAGQFR